MTKEVVMGKLSNNQSIWLVTGILVAAAAGVLLYMMYANTEPAAAPPPSATNDTTQQAPVDTSPTQQTPTDTDTTPTAAVSMEDAERIAVNEFGGTVKETGSDDYKGTPAWEVELMDSKEGRIEVKVDKQTGEILYWELDD